MDLFSGHAYKLDLLREEKWKGKWGERAKLMDFCWVRWRNKRSLAKRNPKEWKNQLESYVIWTLAQKLVEQTFSSLCKPYLISNVWVWITCWCASLQLPAIWVVVGILVVRLFFVCVCNRWIIIRVRVQMNLFTHLRRGTGNVFSLVERVIHTI